MSSIVGVHGIAQQLSGAETLRSEWWPALIDGASAADAKIPDGALRCAFYGLLFRPPGNTREVTGPAYRASDVSGEFEENLLQAWWIAAAAVEPDRVTSPDSKVRASVPKSVQAALRALSRSRFFIGLSERALIGDLKQVRLYLEDAGVRRSAQDAVHSVVTEDTRVIVAHSLGSVVAYEALHRFAADPRWSNVRTLVTLGSPLGIQNLIFHKLLPPPNAGRGVWPPTLARWTNISDDGDVVALEKELGNLFEGSIRDVRIHNGATAHDIRPYLTARETGAAIADGLA